METVYHAWNVVDHARVASGAAELAIFTALLYWFFTSSRVADMLEVVGERVGGWCGRDSSLRQAVRARRRDVYAKLDADAAVRNATLYRLKEGPVVPPPQPHTRPTIGLACPRCAPHSRESWQEADGQSDTVANILDIGRQRFSGGGVVSRHLCDLAQCLQLETHDYKDITPEVVADARFQSAIDEEAQQLADGEGYAAARRRVEARAMAVLASISSAMSNNVLRLVAWLTHKAVRRVAGAGCGTRAAVRLAAARAAGLPLVFVPLHRSHLDYILVTFTLYLTGVRPPLVAAGDNMRIPLFGWFLRGCGAFFIRRGQEGSNHNSDHIYKSALRAYILNSLSANNNLEFFIEGGRTRTGKPQLPKAGILSVILDAYLEGTISDALLVPVTVNYDKLVDGSFVREQLGVPKRMETFWSALRGIWRTLNTNHGGIRVDFNQPVSLKELVSSFDKYSHILSAGAGSGEEVSLDRRLLSAHSRSTMFGAGVSERQRLMVEAIGRHLVYDAAQSTALMCTNVTAYVLAAEMRGGGTLARLQKLVAARGALLRRAGRDLGYCGDVRAAVTRALDTLGRGLVCRGRVVRAATGVGAAIELAYYANAVVAHYAPAAVVATALESLIQSSPDSSEISYDDLMSASLRLAEILSHEFILCPPCQRIEDKLAEAVDELVASDVIAEVKHTDALEEQRWSRRVAAGLDDAPPPAVRYRLCHTTAAAAERRRLILTLRPLLEAYAAACRHVADAPQKTLVTATLDDMLDDFAHNRMTYGEAISTDAIRNCHRLLRQWGVIDIITEDKQRVVRIQEPYTSETRLAEICDHVYRYNMSTPLLDEVAT